MNEKLTYYHVDVFARRQFGGNQLAVFTEPGDISDRKMELIASEMGFSETTYVFPSSEKDIDAELRIFTPAEEIPFAGHPVIGTAYVFAMMNTGKKKPRSLSLQLKSGRVDMDLQYSSGKVNSVTMHQPVPTFGTALQNRGQAARAVGINNMNILGGGVVTNGLDFLIVEADSIESVQKAELSIPEAVSVIERHKVCGIYLFARVEDDKSKNIHARFFAPTLDIIEDPATGSAAGALGGYLSRILKFPSQFRLAIEQGVEMGRSSYIRVDVNCDRGLLQSVSVTGHVIEVGKGEIALQ
jgi:trans-2,3-dihydro-3-hydroxyanthranilate isomerase